MASAEADSAACEDGVGCDIDALEVAGGCASRTS